MTVNIQGMIEAWPALATVIGLVIWFVRLEGMVKRNEERSEARNTATQKEVDTLRIKHESLDSKVVEQLASVRESLARIEGALGVKERQS